MCVEGEYLYVHCNKYKNQGCSSIPFPSFPSPSPLPVPPLAASLNHFPSLLSSTPLHSSPTLSFLSIFPSITSGKYKNLNKNFVHLSLLKKKDLLPPELIGLFSGSHLN